MFRLPIPSTSNCIVFAASIFLPFAWAQPARGQCSPQESDPLFAFDAASNDQFGASVSATLDRVVIGTPFDDLPGGKIDAGSAYVFRLIGAVWTLETKLIAPDSDAGDRFGYSAAIDEETIIVGSPSDDHAGGTDSGSAYVFRYVNGSWSDITKLTTQNAAAGEQFGFSVAISQDTVAVGAPMGHNQFGIPVGSATLLVFSSGTWVQQAKEYCDENFNDACGTAVALSGSTCAIGSPFDNVGPFVASGAVYVYNRFNGVWSFYGRIFQSDRVDAAQLGTSVALDRNTIVAGSSQTESAYVFERECGSWTQRAKLTAADRRPEDRFGRSLSVINNIISVGAPFHDHNEISDLGAVYVFTKLCGQWSFQHELLTSDGVSGDQFGSSVAISNDTLFSSSLFSDYGAKNGGSGYVITLGCDGDRDGVLNAADVCPNTPLGVPIDFEGRPLRDCNRDCLLNALDVQCFVDEILNQ